MSRSGIKRKATVFDYGAGNLHSLVKALELTDYSVEVQPDASKIIETDVLVLPGVGAFSPAAEALGSFRDKIRQAIFEGLPCLGICLGMQLLFDNSDEGPGAGLGVIPGRVSQIQDRRIPHIGWNTLEDPSDPLFNKAPLDLAYFANSYACRPSSTETVKAWTTHGEDRFASVVRSGQVVGVQFHPEKSSRAGIEFLSAFIKETN